MADRSILKQKTSKILRKTRGSVTIQDENGIISVYVKKPVPSKNKTSTQTGSRTRTRTRTRNRAVVEGKAYNQATIALRKCTVNLKQLTEKDISEINNQLKKVPLLRSVELNPTTNLVELSAVGQTTSHAGLDLMTSAPVYSNEPTGSLNGNFIKVTLSSSADFKSSILISYETLASIFGVVFGSQYSTNNTMNLASTQNNFIDESVISLTQSISKDCFEESSHQVEPDMNGWSYDNFTVKFPISVKGSPNTLISINTLNPYDSVMFAIQRSTNDTDGVKIDECDEADEVTQIEPGELTSDSIVSNEENYDADSSTSSCGDPSISPETLDSMLRSLYGKASDRATRKLF